ncbi:MAG TPA: hypothetical protein VEJ18_06235 [Planctomycetota bacterium]|nr:hypothetical protein [Planctomycetota bacterium]
MTMADVFAITLFFVGLVLVLPAVWLLFGALWPGLVGRAQARIPAAPMKTFFAGLGVAALMTAVVVGLSALNVPVLALVAFAASLGWSFVGVAALARHLGTRLSSTAEAPWRASVRGGVVLALSFLVPFLGWILLFPIALVLGCGATALGLRRAATPLPASPLPVRLEAKEEVLA